MDYRAYAALSALFAGATAVLSKKGVEGVPTNLALAVRVSFVVLFAWGMAVITRQTAVAELTKAQWQWLALSAVGTGLSWFFYFRALQGGPVSAVAPIDKLSFVIAMGLGFWILKERVTPQLLGGAALIIAGVLVTLSGPAK
jgi:transporter family protein